MFTQVIRGAHQWVNQAEKELLQAIDQYGAEKPVGWGGQTSYYLPMSYALMGLEAKTLGDLRPQLEHARELLGPVPSDEMWLPYLGDGLDAGAASMLATEGSDGAADGQRLPDARRLARLHLRHDHAASWAFNWSTAACRGSP